MKIVNAAEMREIDRDTSERFGIASEILMENAGAGVADFVLRRWPEAKKFLVVCGKGMNGGDGLVCARHLLAVGKRVEVMLLAAPSEVSGDAAVMLQRLGIAPRACESVADLSGNPAENAFQCDVIVDAILGSGFRPPLTNELLLAAMARMNGAGRPVVSIDVPSGMDSDALECGGDRAQVHAHSVVTFTAPKKAHLFGEAAEDSVVVLPIGSPREAVRSASHLDLTTAADLRDWAKPRRKDSNKGDFGHVLVVGGSKGKAGAAAMAGMAALRAGAGMVTVAVPRSIAELVAGFAPELMTAALPETEEGAISMSALNYGQMDKLMEGKQAVAIGPGISRDPEAAEFVRAVCAKATSFIPVVLDADGLNAFEGRASELGAKRSAQLVLTPHPGEMARLLGAPMGTSHSERLQVAAKFAKQHGVILLLKGRRTLVADPSGHVWVNATGNAGMATAGAGDVLTGIIAGLMGERRAADGDSKSEPDAARTVAAAAYLHGLAGDIACERLGERSLMATDILKDLSRAFGRLKQLTADPVVVIR